MAYCDVSTGGFYVLELHGSNWAGELMDELARIQPTELVANDALFLQELLVKRLQSSYYLQCLGSDAFDESLAGSRMLRHFQKANLKELGCDGITCGISAAGALLSYLEDTQKNALTHIRNVRVVSPGKYMRIDAASRRNLELTTPLRRMEAKNIPCYTSGSDRYRHGRPQAAGLDRTALTEYCHHQQPAGRSGGPLFPSRGTGGPGQSSFLGI